VKKRISLYALAIAHAYFKLGKYSDAIAKCDKALEIAPDYAEAWSNKGVILYNLGEYDKAIMSYDKAIEINPNDDYAWYNRGLALDDLGMNKEAIKSYSQAIKLDHSYTDRVLGSDGVKIVVDQPVLNGVLDFDKYSKRLANVVQNSKPRFTIGVFGRWGTGKTTLMMMIKEELDKREKIFKNQEIVTVWFDAWKYEREQYLAVIPFLRLIKSELDKFTKLNNISQGQRWERVKEGIDLL
jgi:tetratricopeptide (TPR) repeat protein